MSQPLSSRISINGYWLISLSSGTSGLDTVSPTASAPKEFFFLPIGVLDPSARADNDSFGYFEDKFIFSPTCRLPAASYPSFFRPSPGLWHSCRGHNPLMSLPFHTLKTKDRFSGAATILRLFTPLKVFFMESPPPMTPSFWLSYSTFDRLFRTPVPDRHPEAVCTPGLTVRHLRVCFRPQVLVLPPTVWFFCRVPLVCAPMLCVLFFA